MAYVFNPFTGNLDEVGSGGTTSGATFLANLEDVDSTSKTDKSVLYYNQATGKFTADSIYTIITVTDGGNF